MSDCKKGNLKCTFGINTKNSKLNNSYQSDYICNPNEHGWTGVTEQDFFNNVEYIKKCNNPDKPEVENTLIHTPEQNNYGYRYQMSKGNVDPEMENKFIYPSPPVRKKCIICRKRYSGYNELKQRQQEKLNIKKSKKEKKKLKKKSKKKK